MWMRPPPPASRRSLPTLGAVLTITPVADSGAPDDQDGAADPGRPQRDDTPLSLAPQWGELEPPPVVAAPVLDLSYLSLVPSDHWTLEDCEAPPALITNPPKAGRPM